ncbi:MAG TPA: glycosyltransferase family 9 protein [Chloroflexota bacterium]|nr:glycosyltransferase family 9 protein [Chloroflexota bacterium]
MIGLIEPRRDGRRLALHLLGQLFGPPRGGGGGPRTILVMRPDHLGDLLFLTPALRRLRRAFPDARILGLVGLWGLPVLRTNPNLDGLIGWDFPWFNRQPRRSLIAPYLSLLRLARRLRAERIDIALQFRSDFWWGALAVRLAGIPEQIGYDVPLARPFLSQALPIIHGLHAVDENIRLVESLAGPAPGTSDALEFPIADGDRERARQLLGPLADYPRLVAIQVGAGAAVKRWPLDRLAAVGRGLADSSGVVPVVIGGSSERSAVHEVVRRIGPPAIGLAGVTTVGELAAVLERCALALGPDSGPLHLAVAVGTPTLHLFGPADPRRFGPYGDRSRHRVILARWPCCPCNQLDFPAGAVTAHACMAAIPVETVLEHARDLLERAAGNHRAVGSSAEGH